MATEMNSLDEWQLLKTLAIELSVLTESVYCECSICEFRLSQSSGLQLAGTLLNEIKSILDDFKQLILDSMPEYNSFATLIMMPMYSYVMEKQQLSNRMQNQLLSQTSHHFPMYQQPPDPQHLTGSSVQPSLSQESMNTVDISCNTKNIQNASYKRLFETVNAIFDRSSAESSILLAQNAWCQDVSLCNVWNNIQQSRTASVQLLVRSLSCEGSASLAAAVATASPAGRRFRKDVQQLLEKVFQCKPWPNPTEKTMLARRCGLTVRQVGVWV
ncbi:hypothetical protein PMAC_001416 [Pneumocystis sp. 'macacae']|nr:hypothetical protein PMAC_001416 [Pneumocystis sp. 'macacae']